MKIKLLIAALIISTCTSMAQEILTLTWNIGFPASKTSDYVESESYKGFTFSARGYIDEQNSIGVMSGWNVFDEKHFEPIPLESANGSGVISGTQVHVLNVVPILASFFHRFSTGSDRLGAFAGLNVGTYYILQRLNLGVYVIDNDNWHFGLAPEAGLTIPIEDLTKLVLAARYNYAFDSGTAFGGAEDNYYAFWEVNIGFTFSSYIW